MRSSGSTLTFTFKEAIFSLNCNGITRRGVAYSHLALSRAQIEVQASFKPLLDEG